MHNSKKLRRGFRNVANAVFCAALTLSINTGSTPHSLANSTPSDSTKTSAPAQTLKPEHSPAARPVADVGCQGRILPKSRVRQLVAPADQGSPIIAKLFVQEGDSIKEGDTLATLAAEAPAQLLRAQAVARIATAQLNETAAFAAAGLAVKELQLQRADAAGNLAAATLALEAARAGAARKQIPDGVIRELEAALNAQTSALETIRAGKPAFVARIDAAVATALAQRKEAGNWGAGRIAEATLAEARAARENSMREYEAREAAAKASQDLARAQLESARARNALPERTAAELAAAENQVAAAAQRQTSLDNYALALKNSNDAKIALAQAETAEASAALLLAEKRLALTSIRSPITGRVLRLHARAGEGCAQNGCVAEVADLSQMLVKAEVAVPDLPRVKLGAAAEIEISGWNSPPFKGTVKKIGLIVTPSALADENPAAFKDLRIVPVEIEFDPETSAALSALTGAQVRVKIKG